MVASLFHCNNPVSYHNCIAQHNEHDADHKAILVRPFTVNCSSV